MPRQNDSLHLLRSVGCLRYEPVRHFLSGWVFANSVRLDRRGMAAVTVAAVIPDIDGIGIVAEVLIHRRDGETPAVIKGKSG